MTGFFFFFSRLRLRAGQSSLNGCSLLRRSEYMVVSVCVCVRLNWCSAETVKVSRGLLDVYKVNDWSAVCQSKTPMETFTYTAQFRNVPGRSTSADLDLCPGQSGLCPPRPKHNTQHPDRNRRSKMICTRVPCCVPC